LFAEDLKADEEMIESDHSRSRLSNDQLDISSRCGRF
jgi:hypothetical protein